MSREGGKKKPLKQPMKAQRELDETDLKFIEDEKERKLKEKLMRDALLKGKKK
ncbi:hypothetical protein NEDG_01854 [Nematocida displodere]|uniref:Translation machinery-associated protein 7 n=1 Tax=Nematocida displodere TaxID=1805483 RepID=A0A177EI65_9MICR|nr:hypothetical protein NEDG_01854 [Nematocida displodere]